MPAVTPFAGLSRPLTAGLSPHARDLIADELMTVVVEIRKEANAWRFANSTGMEATIVTCTGLADVLVHRAEVYRSGR
ncbi:hypothetical protein CVV72_41220 (plasmid) [Amycolatopsis sp. TNS106]|nr:hypothetical protein CVV72_41220 [Amycolatopsis sp. TNS106]